LKSDQKSLQLRHEKVCADLRSVKDERDNCLKENTQLSVALQSAKKDLKNSHENLEKKMMHFKAEVANLQEYKIRKTSEEKHANKKREKRALPNKKKGVQEKVEEVITSEVGGASVKPETVSLPNIPVHNYFDALEDSENFDDGIIGDEIEYEAKHKNVESEKVKEHKEIDHQERLSYNCKLCIDKFESPELLVKHRNFKSHQMLSESVDQQFMLQSGNSCKECYILETEETYNICENDDHFETFDNIWSNRQNSSL
jgi:hypothetical protein